MKNNNDLDYDNLPFDRRNIIVEMEFGSHLYGLDTPESDKDYIGVYMPPLFDILSGNVVDTIDLSSNKSKNKNTSSDVDRTFYSIQYFIKQVMMGNTNVLDMLHARDSSILVNSTFWRNIVCVRDFAYTKNMASFVGYVRTQASKYGAKGDRLRANEAALEVVSEYLEKPNTSTKDRLELLWDDLPTGPHAEFVESPCVKGQEDGPTQCFYELTSRKYQNSCDLEYFMDRVGIVIDSYGARARKASSNGLDNRALSHALRAGYQARAIFTRGGYEYPLEENDFIKAVKSGELDFKSVVQPELEALVTEVENLSELSALPDRVDTERWNFMLADMCARFYDIEAQFSDDYATSD